MLHSAYIITNLSPLEVNPLMAVNFKRRTRKNFQIIVAPSRNERLTVEKLYLEATSWIPSIGKLWKPLLVPIQPTSHMYKWISCLLRNQSSKKITVNPPIKGTICHLTRENSSCSTLFHFGDACVAHLFEQAWRKCTNCLPLRHKML